jgi:hypothetical protein
MRRHRTWIVAIVMWCLAFAQAATAAHACSMLAIPSPSKVQTVKPPTQPMDAACTGMASQSDSTVNLCASHCVGNDQSNANADVPTAAIAPQPALNVRLSVDCVRARSSTSLVSPTAAPPPHLRFARFLI